MIIEKLFSFGFAALFALSTQSLSDLARQEAERRKALEEQGIQGKVVGANPENLAPDGNLTTSTPDTREHSEKPSARNGRPASLKTYRSAIERLERSISKTEDQLKLLRSRLQEERWALPKVGRVSRRSGTADSRNRIQTQVGELEIKLKQMQKERADVYEKGKKAGFLPGELDGKGIIP